MLRKLTGAKLVDEMLRFTDDYARQLLVGAWMQPADHKFEEEITLTKEGDEHVLHCVLPEDEAD